MAHYRSEYRATARAALAGDPRFSRFTVLTVWPGSVDENTLPILGVLTPQDRSEQHSRASVTRRTLMQVAVRRKGGDDIEDVLDQDSDQIEAVVTAALMKIGQGCFLESTSLVTSTDGRQNVGTLVMDFRLVSFRPVISLPAAP